jgi:hypothetical protein
MSGRPGSRTGVGHGHRHPVGERDEASTDNFLIGGGHEARMGLGVADRPGDEPGDESRVIVRDGGAYFDCTFPSELGYSR